MGDDRPRVLLVDDERLARQIYADYLQAAGCEVDVAESAQAAFALFATDHYRVVVTDLLLPDLDGLEVLQYVKRVDPETDVVVITGHERVEPAVRALKLGASDYLIKPVTKDTLAVAVGRALGMRRVLQENAALKTSLRLFEAAGRLQAAADWVAVANALMPALGSELLATSGAFFRSASGGLELVRSEGLAMEDETALVDRVLPAALRAVQGEGVEVTQALPGTEALPSLAGRFATLVPLFLDGTVLGAAALFSEAMPPAAGVRGAEFLAKSAAVTLATLERFQKTELLALIDDHTRLFNARYLKQALEDACQHEEAPFAVLFADLDHFKQVNDAFGHLVGSRLLQEAARVIKASLRERDIATRYGGDEFCLLLKRTDQKTALKIAERLRATVADHVFLAREGKNVKMTASIGIACFPEHARDAAALLGLADEAMYRGKREARNIVYLAASQAA